MSSLFDRIHELVRNSNWEDKIEEWEEDKEERCVAYTLFDGSTLVVFEDGRYEHYTKGQVLTGTLAGS